MLWWQDIVLYICKRDIPQNPLHIISCNGGTRFVKHKRSLSFLRFASYKRATKYGVSSNAKSTSNSCFKIVETSWDCINIDLPFYCLLEPLCAVSILVRSYVAYDLNIVLVIEVATFILLISCFFICLSYVYLFCVVFKACCSPKSFVFRSKGLFLRSYYRTVLVRYPIAGSNPPT